MIARDRVGEPLLIEVLRSIRGTSNAELRKPAYDFALGENQVRVQAPGPIALLQAKIANLAGINQGGRQDGRHVVILARIMPAYLADLRALVEKGGLDERKLIEFLEWLLAVVTSPPGRKACSSLRLNPRDLFAELISAGLPKLQSFLAKRLPHALAVT